MSPAPPSMFSSRSPPPPTRCSAIPMWWRRRIWALRPTRRRRMSRCRSPKKCPTISKIKIPYEGSVANLKIKALTSAAIAGLLRPSLADINVVSAPSVAAQRGIVIEEMTRAVQGDYETLSTLSVPTANQERAVGGTVFHDGKPRILSIKGIKVDAEFTPSMIYVTNDDKPGFIGRFAGLLGEAGVNIATFALGRDQEGGSAIALVAIDGPAPEGVLANVGEIAGVRQAKALKF